MDRIHFLNTTILNVKRKYKILMQIPPEKRTMEDKEKIEEYIIVIQDLIEERDQIKEERNENENS